MQKKRRKKWKKMRQFERYFLMRVIARLESSLSPSVSVGKMEAQLGATLKPLGVMMSVMYGGFREVLLS